MYLLKMVSVTPWVCLSSEEQKKSNTYMDGKLKDNERELTELSQKNL